MSLKSLHIAFISVCTGLCAFMILWGVQSYRSEASTLGMEVGIVGVVGLLALVPYFFWVRKKFQKIQAALFAALILPALLHPWSAHACAVCFGDPNSGMSKGIKAGVILLVAVVGVVLGGIASVVISWSRRAKTLTHHLNP
ncbi:MAG TPA: hypothetical protein VFX30_08030 [bacterium]|nr:hypothetical protein [bacterium]